MSKRKITDEALAMIVVLGDRGKSDQFIADALRAKLGIELSTSAISWHRLRQCAEPDKVTTIPPIPTSPTCYGRNGHEVRRFTQAEDAELLRLEAEGLGPQEIGRRLGRKSNSITGRLMTLARHDARRERAQA